MGRRRKKKNRYNRPPKKSADAKKQEQTEAEVAPAKPVKTRMEITIQVCAAIAAFIALVAGLLLKLDHKYAAIWTTCCAGIAMVIGLFAWIHNIEAKKDAEKIRIAKDAPVTSPATNDSPKEGSEKISTNKDNGAKNSPENLKNPRFTDEAGTVQFTFGNNTAITTLDGLRTYKKRHGFKFSPFETSGTVPQFYCEGDDLFLDVVLYDLPNVKVELKHNNLTGKPAGWDMNMSEKALEVVNESNEPILQLIYKSNTHVALNGLFKTRLGISFAHDSGVQTLGYQTPFTNTLKRIFKYPAWKYPGEYAD